jgi:hypothetical protein
MRHSEDDASALCAARCHDRERLDPGSAETAGVTAKTKTPASLPGFCIL